MRNLLLVFTTLFFITNSSITAISQPTNNISFSNKMQLINLPFFDTKTPSVVIPNQWYGFQNTPEVLFKLYDDLNLSKYTIEKQGTMVKRFDVTNGQYRLIEVLAGESEWVTCFLLTLDSIGNIIGNIETTVCFEGDIYIKQYSISKEMKVTVYILNVINPSNADPFNFKSVLAQRFDTVYQISPAGQFIQVQQRKYLQKEYSKEYLLDKHLNIWQGNEVLN